MTSRPADPWDLTSMTLPRAQARRWQVAVIPTGATEAHNRHLPYGEDVLHTTEVVRRACARAWPRCESVVALPPIPYGVDSNLMDFPLTIHVAQATVDAMLRDIVDSLRHHGIRKIVLVNGHGGNDFVPLVRDIQGVHPDTHLFLCNWWLVGADRWSDFFDKPEDHAGIMETSVAMSLFPQLVEDIDNAGDGKAVPFRFEALRKGWVKTSRRFARMNDHCAVGDPRGASPEAGEKYLGLVTERLGDFLAELANAEVDARFPHENK